MLEISFWIVKNILNNNVNMGWIVSKFVPCLLSEKQMEDRVNMSGTARGAGNRPRNQGIVSCNKWRGDSSSQMWMACSVCFLECSWSRVLWISSTGANQHTITTTIATPMPYNVCMKICGGEAQKSEIWGISFSTVTTRLLTALSLHKFLATNKMTVIPRPPYSSHLAPCDFLLFPQLKMALTLSPFHSNR